MSDCIFCKIIAGQINSKKVYEDSNIFSFYDASPVAEVHVIVVPKKHIDSLKHMANEDINLVGNLNFVIPKIAHTLGLTNGFKTIINTGKEGGQNIYHLHYHILGGKFTKKDPFKYT